ncbi:Txe/YoeB family addiction module toxin [bacterium]|nr:Txe/YoeB family addiction module toxin [bacterium]
MSRTLTFSKQAWEEYLYWQSQDKKTLEKINNLLEGLQRDNQEIIGKAERLVGNLSGHCSIRINSKDRLVYQIKNQTIEIKQCKGHYDDK